VRGIMILVSLIISGSTEEKDFLYPNFRARASFFPPSSPSNMLARLPRLASRTTPFTIRLAIRSSPLPFQHVRFHSSASNPSSDASAAGDGSLIQNPRELIAAKAKAFEEKYKDKLKLKQKESVPLPCKPLFPTFGLERC
jgi:hypothetical protein